MQYSEREIKCTEPYAPLIKKYKKLRNKMFKQLRNKNLNNKN